MEQYVFAGLFAIGFLLLVISLIRRSYGRPYYFILVCAILLSGFGAYEAHKNLAKPEKYSTDVFLQNIYMAARLLEDGRAGDSISASGAAGEADAENENVVLLQALALNTLGSFDLSSELIGERKGEYYSRLQQCNASGEVLDSVSIREAAGKVIASLEIPESVLPQYDMMLRIRYFRGEEAGKPDDTFGNSENHFPAEEESAVLNVSNPDSSYLPSGQKEYGDMLISAMDKDYDRTCKILEDMAASGDFKARIALAEMYSSGYIPLDFRETDEEYDELLNRVTGLQLELDELSEKLESVPNPTDSGDPVQESEEGRRNRKLYDLKTTEVHMAEKELEFAAARRAARYLGEMEVDERDALAYHLVMARIYFRQDEREKAKEELDWIFYQKDFSRSAFLGLDLLFLRESFVELLETENRVNYDAAYKILEEDILHGVVEVDDEFSVFLENYLREIYTGIRILSLTTRDYPRISARFSCRSDSALSRDRLEVLDTGNSIVDFSLRKEEEQERIAVSIVLDISGSMQGESLSSAKSAISNFVSSLGEGVMLSLVTFSNTSTLELGLTDSKYEVEGVVRRLTAYGGTNISAGLSEGLRSLAGFQGKKVIILLSDGYDSQMSSYDSIIEELLSENVQVHAIGMVGADKATLKNISVRTGGIFASVRSAEELLKVYDEVSGSFMNIYVMEYDIQNQEEEDRSLRLAFTDDPSFDFRIYHIGFPAASGTENRRQVTNFYRHISA